MKTFIWGGMFVGTGVGGFIPLLWTLNPFSLSSVVLTFVGGILGIWAGYQLGKRFGA